MAKRSYLLAAFNARPLGMPVPPNWFAVGAIALLGAFINPGLWLIGAGIEGLYLWALAKNPRFRNAIDAQQGGEADESWTSRYEKLIDNLEDLELQLQYEVERQAAEIVDLLTRAGAQPMQLADVRQMAWLHLRLMSARAALSEVIVTAQRDEPRLAERERTIETRLQKDTDAELKRSLEQQLEVIRSRRTAHADAQRRAELVDAELERLRQQVALVREQALLATDEFSVAQSLDVISASLNEANRWLTDQRELFAGLGTAMDEAPPPELLQPKTAGQRSRKGRGKVSA
jgi:hypothetical protein